MPWLERRIPPLLVFAVFAGGAVGGALAAPAANLPFPGHRGVSGLALLAGVAVALAGVLEFRAARTSAHPLDLGRTTALVTRGIYRWTRNPMYLGLALALLAVATWHASLVGYAMVPAFCAYMTRFQIRPEERALNARFGAEYRAYAARMRRWI